MSECIFSNIGITQDDLSGSLLFLLFLDDVLVNINTTIHTNIPGIVYINDLKIVYLYLSTVQSYWQKSHYHFIYY